MQRHAAPAYAFCAQPLAPVSCIHSLKPAPLHAMLSWSGGGDRAGGHVLQDSGTDGLCSCTAQSDGRHFPPLIPWFVVQLAHKVHQALQGGAKRLRDAQAESGEYPGDRTYVS